MNKAAVKQNIVGILVLLLVFALGLAGYFVYQNYQLRVELNELKGAQKTGVVMPDSKIYDKDIPPETSCSQIKDDLCPQWCMPGADYDCCLRSGEKEWIPGRGCYSK